MLEYRKARAEEAADILDFINYVFSQAHRPHDFKKFNPAMYGGDYPFWKEHYVAVRDGRIKATLSVSKRESDCAGVHLTRAHIGQVSVHPYERGEGHMKHLMRMADEDMAAAGYDYAELNGLRQRYQYFGYTQGNVRYMLDVTPTNIRHTLGEAAPRLIWQDGRLLDGEGVQHGALNGGRLTLDDYSLAADACAAYLSATGADSLRLSVAPYETACLRAIGAFCENTTLQTTMQYRVYHFDRVLLAGLGLRAAAGLLPDGEATLNVEGEAWHMVCKDGKATVEPGDPAAAPMLTKMQAQDLMFSPLSRALYPDMPAEWFPISL